MHTKWLLILLGLKLSSAIVLIDNVACTDVVSNHEPQRTNKRNAREIEEEIEIVLDNQPVRGARDGIRIKAIVLIHPLMNCTNKKECDTGHASCLDGRCVCDPGYMALLSKCFRKANIHEACQFDAQCSTGECSVPKDCKCNFAAGEPGFCVFNENPFETNSGMMKVLMVITGFVVVATITCITTVVYRRMRPRVHSRAPVLDVSGDRIEDGINPVPIIMDSPPPQYEEVVKIPCHKSPVSSPTSDYAEPPSYGEYLEHQRNSLQPMIETHSPLRWSPLPNRNSRNGSLFLGRF